MIFALGTYNRRYLLELANAEFKRVCRYGLSLCLMMLDLDNFKAINDNQGHPVGDEALKKACKKSSLKQYGIVTMLVDMVATNL